MSKSSLWSQGRKTPPGRKNPKAYTPHTKRKRQWYRNTSKHRHLERNKNEKGRRQLLNNYVWLSGRMHIEERLNEGSWFQSKQKDENETKQTQHQRKTAWHLQVKRPEDTSSRHLINYGGQTSPNTLALGDPLLGTSCHVRAYYCRQ